ncbi:MAG: hypothetical protein Q8Q08_12975 [Candidatus Omnitrophota bacterium]|nr:hypothetical protein [Candidatus Omnitrophota bacterium]
MKKTELTAVELSRMGGRARTKATTKAQRQEWGRRGAEIREARRRARE